nr:hypothetical protein 30 [Alphaproteobacteria bacterium]
MASILKVDEMQGVTSAGDITITSEGGSATMQLQQGLAKAWINLDGTASGAAARDSFNTSGTVDNGTGNYTVSLSNNLSNANYATPATVGNTDRGRYGTLSDSDSKSTSAAVFFGFQTSTGDALDPAEYSIVFHGDLA